MPKLYAVLMVCCIAACQPEQESEHVRWVAEVQEAIARYPVIRDEQKVRDLIPYESITIERGACFGPCPIYKMTLSRDGTATLTTDHLNPEQALRYSTTLNIRDYARVAQLVEVVGKSSPKREYIGQWTDDYSVTITVKRARGSWVFTDYGQVGPPELWALEQIMFGMRSSLPWAGGVK